MTESQQNQPTADTWAVVEVMGHARYAGRVSQHTALGGALIRRPALPPVEPDDYSDDFEI